MLEIFPNSSQFDYIVLELEKELNLFSEAFAFVKNAKIDTKIVALYLFKEMMNDTVFVTSLRAKQLSDEF